MLEGSATQPVTANTGPRIGGQAIGTTERLAYPIGLTASNHPFATSGSERGTLEVHGMRANDVVTYAPSVAISVSR